MTRFSMVFAAALVLGAATGAHATRYDSPILTAGSGANGGSLFCFVSNVGKKPAEVSGTILGLTGNPVANVQNDCLSDFAGVLPPGASCTIAISGGATGRCTVDASGKIRAVLYVRDVNGNATVAVPLTK